MSTIQFVVPTFNQTFTMSAAGTLLVPESTTIPAHDAIAVFNVLTTDMQNVFQYQTDDININDIDTQDINYYVRLTDGNSSALGDAVWPLNLSLNPANAMMDEAASLNGIDVADTNIAASKKLVKDDMLRYLSQRLFNTSKGVDLFSNVLNMTENISGKCGSFTGGAYNSIHTALSSICTTSTASNSLLYTDISNNNIRFLGNDSSGNNNITRMLMNQIAQYAPARFNALTDSLGDYVLRAVPFIDGDVLNFTVIFNAASGQHNLTGVSAIPSRTYLIKLILGSGTLRNTQVVDSALVGDCAYSKFIASVVPALSSASTPLYGGMAVPAAVPSPYNYFGWYFIGGVSPLDLVFSPNTASSTVANITSIYITARVISVTRPPVITIYTAPTFSGDAAAGYHSAVTYSPSGIVLTDDFDWQFGFDLTGVDGGATAGFAANLLNGYQQGAMTRGTPEGPFAAAETILSINIQTSSLATSSETELILTSLVICETAGSVVTNKVYNFQPF
jgi:hypothetical protein